MKTNYLPRSKAKQTRRTHKQILIVGVLLLVCFGILFFSRGLLSAVLEPVWKGQNIMARGVVNTATWFSTRDALVRENAAMRERLVSQEAELMDLRGIAEREQNLLAVLGRDPVEGSVLASVLVRPPETPYDILIIDIGYSEGIDVGYVVRMPEGPLLGVVEEVFSRTSKVKLHTSNGERTAAVLERHEVPVILAGQGGGNFRLALPREVEVEEGDRILSATVPAELIAVVGRIKVAPTDSFKEVLAQGATNLFTLRHVLVSPR